jgi:hypothetical protein
MVIVPSTAVETMGLGALGGLASFGQITSDTPKTSAQPPKEEGAETAETTQ